LSDQLDEFVEIGHYLSAYRIEHVVGSPSFHPSIAVVVLSVLALLSLHLAGRNIQIVCWFINRWKNDDSDANFKKLLERIILAQGRDVFLKNHRNLPYSGKLP
jgi:hypothetical protein